MFRDISHILAPSKVGEQEVDAEKKTVSAMADQERIPDVSPQGETAASSHGADATESPSKAARRRHEAERGVQLLTSLLQANESALDQDVNNLKEERLALKKRKKELSAQLRNKGTQKQRLRSKAKQLSTDDLLEVYAMRVRSAAASSSKNSKREETGEPDGAKKVQQ